MPTQPTFPTRPGSLAQVLRLVRDEGEPLRFCLAGFLDHFYGDRASHLRRARIEEDPGVTGDPKLNALIGAIGEHLHHRRNLGEPPAWTQDPARFRLDKPWFIGPERMKGFLLAGSPPAYRRRLIFTEAEPLRRVNATRRPMVVLRNHALWVDADGRGNRRPPFRPCTGNGSLIAAGEILIVLVARGLK